jgi:hypothetical protein
MTEPKSFADAATEASSQFPAGNENPRMIRVMTVVVQVHQNPNEHLSNTSTSPPPPSLARFQSLLRSWLSSISLQLLKQKLLPYCPWSKVRVYVSSHDRRTQYTSEDYCVLGSECKQPLRQLRTFRLHHSEDGSIRIIRNVGPTPTNTQLSDSNKNLLMGRLADWPSVVTYL